MSFLNPRTWLRGRSRSKGHNDPENDQHVSPSPSPSPCTNASHQQPLAFPIVQPAPASAPIPQIVSTPVLLQPQDKDVEIEDATVCPATPPPPTLPPTSLLPGHNQTTSYSVPVAQHLPLEAGEGGSGVATSSSRSRSPSVVLDTELGALGPLGANCTLSLQTVINELASIPCICTVVQCLSTVFQAVEKSRVNREQWRLLKGRCVMVARIAGTQVLNNGGERYQGLANASQLLVDTIGDIGQRINYWNERNEILSIIQYDQISEEIKRHFSSLDECLKSFSFATNVTHLQWINHFNKVQLKEVTELEKMRTLMEANANKMVWMTASQERLVTLVTETKQMLERTMDEKFQVLQNRTTTPVEIYDDAKLMVRMLRTVADIQLPSHLLLGKQCIPDTSSPIRTGTTCDVYSASFLSDEKVAKKVFRIGMSDKDNVDRYAERFMRIAKLWATFKCDYTLPFYGIGMETYENQNHFQLYMVSPLMTNFDAMKYLKEHRKDPGMKEGILRIITDAAKGLQYLHHREPPVVHSGMRGENVLITESGGGVLGGFGLTKALQNTTGTEKTPPAVMTGQTMAQRWMAPEIFQADDPVLQTPSDIWSWAMTALEIISGRIPYYDSKQTHTIVRILQSCELPRRDKYREFEEHALKPDEMWALLVRCWAAEPEQRPTIDEVVIALQKMKN